VEQNSELLFLSVGPDTFRRDTRPTGMSRFQNAIAGGYDRESAR
jgi:hypothetical protein